MSDICEKCGCPEGVDGHDLLHYRLDQKVAYWKAMCAVSWFVGAVLMYLCCKIG